MIVVVKAPNYKKIFAKLFVVCVAGIVGIWYYFETQIHTTEEKHDTNLTETAQSKYEKRAKALEKIILNEAEICIDLLNQAKVKKISVVADKLVIVCDVDIDIEPVLVRYGANALVKNSLTDVKIAVDLAYITENKYEET